MSVEIHEITHEVFAAMLKAEREDREAFQIEPDMIEDIESYSIHRIPPGGFYRAVFENNLAEAALRADLRNRRRLFEIVQYCWNHIPNTCWGSPEKVSKWLGKEAV